MLSLRELERVARVVEARLVGHVVQAWVQPDGEHLALELYGPVPGEEAARKTRLLLVAAEGVARISELPRLPRAAETPPAFVAWLKAHGSRARLRGARIVDGDRQLALAFEAREGRFELLLSLFGRRSNLYRLDAEGRVQASLRPLSETRSELSLGEPWASPGGALPSAGEDRFAAVDDADLLAAIEAEYGPREQARAGTDLARQLLAALRKERKAADRRLARIEAELAEAEGANALQRQGELLKGALGRIEPGAEQIELEDWETGEPVRVPLDPRKSPKQNLEATFKRYQKLVRRLAKAGGQVDEARARATGLRELEARCKTLAEAVPGSGEEAAAELEAIAARPEIAKLLERTPARAPTAREEKEKEKKLPLRLRGVPRHLRPRRYVSRDGLEIWVGRSAEGNDHLTTRLARGKDLFFHLDGAPGSHVILRTEGADDPPHESILDACELAVRFSKQKNAGRADVHVVPIKQVKKPRGAKPGLVWVTGGRSVHLRRDEKRLARLMESVVED